MPIYADSITSKAQAASFVAKMMKKGVEGKLVFHSEDADNFVNIAPIIDNITKQQIASVSVILRAEQGKLGLLDVDLTLSNKSRLVHFYGHLPGSEEHHEYYQAEIEGQDGRFVAETVNRYALWDKSLVDTVHEVSLSAFPFRIDVYNNAQEVSDEMGVFPVESPIGTVSGVTDDFCMPIESENGAGGFTYFLAKPRKMQDIEIDLGRKGLFRQEKLHATILQIECFAGVLPALVGRETFNLDQFTKDKTLAICAYIRADLGADPDPRAVRKK